MGVARCIKNTRQVKFLDAVMLGWNTHNLLSQLQWIDQNARYIKMMTNVKAIGQGLVWAVFEVMPMGSLVPKLHRQKFPFKKRLIQGMEV